MKNLTFAKRLRFAFTGWWHAFRSEKSFRAQSALGVGALSVLICLRPSPIWWALFSIGIGMVLAAELINTALEAALDRLHPEQNPMIAIAKDCAAGAVLICSITALAIFFAFLAEFFLVF